MLLCHLGYILDKNNFEEERSLTLHFETFSYWLALWIYAQSSSRNVLQCSTLSGIQEAQSKRRHQEWPAPSNHIQSFQMNATNVQPFRTQAFGGWFTAKPYQQRNVILMLATRNKFSQKLGDKMYLHSGMLSGQHQGKIEFQVHKHGKLSTTHYKVAKQ